MSIVRLKRLVERAEKNARVREAEVQYLAGYVEIDGCWVNPMDFVSPEDTIAWARNVDEAIKSNDGKKLRHLGKVWECLIEDGLRRAKIQSKNRSGPVH